MSEPNPNTFATEKQAWGILGPESAGWIIQTFVSGACYQKAAPLYSDKTTMKRSTRYLLAAVLFLNALDLGTTIAEQFL